MKKRITIRVDEDVLEWFKAQGKGYQSKINDVLRDCMVKYVQDELDSLKESSIEPIYKDSKDLLRKCGVRLDTIKETNQFFKPMPKPEKGKKSRCRP